MPGTLRKLTSYQIVTNKLFIHTMLIVGMVIQVSCSSVNATVISNNAHHRRHSTRMIPRHGGGNSSSNLTTVIGQQCEHTEECVNFSICKVKVFEDNLVLKVCKCDSRQMNRLGNSCFVKPGHQCYFPKRNEHGRRLLSCMPETECRSGVTRTGPENGYCMCKDQKEDEPFRLLNVEWEISRCGAIGVLFNVSKRVLLICAFLSCTSITSLF